MKRYVFSLFFLLVLVLGLSLWFSAGLVSSQEDSARLVGEEELRPAIRVQKSNEAKLFAIPGVVAVGVGLTEDGKKPAIHVYYNKDVPNASAAAIPSQMADIPVRMFETDEVKAFDGPPGNNHKQTFALPVPMGVSTGASNTILAGTLGYRVHRIGQPSVVGYITNNHVAARGVSGGNNCPTQLNPLRLAPFGLDQCQPGRLDAAGNVCVAPPIGDLVQVIPIIMGGSFENTVDAVFVSSTRSLVNKLILDIGNPSPLIQAPTVGLAVRKSGRTTGFTTGTIQTINTTVNVNYSSGSSVCGIAKFVGQIAITPGTFGAAGDSGSPILGATDSSGRRRPVGLLFAGSSTTVFSNVISDVLGALHSQIDIQ